MHKLSHLVGQEWLPHSHTPTFSHSKTSTGTNRIESVAPAGEVEPFLQLTVMTEPPYRLLYVLHTPRGEGEPGRYMSPELSAADVNEFVAQFRDYLGADARFDLWSHSIADGSTVVWDRHNHIFAYGNLGAFAERLRALGFTEGETSVPSPHQHHYREEFDNSAAAILSNFDWQYSELRPEDEQ
jgi:hypothetical protein